MDLKDAVIKKVLELVDLPTDEGVSNLTSEISKIFDNQPKGKIVVNFTENDANDMVSEVYKGIDHFATWTYNLDGREVDVKITLGDDE